MFACDSQGDRMQRFRALDDMQVHAKRVLVRVDLNVPMQAGRITDTTRIDRCAETLRWLAGAGAKVVVLSHFGRPDGKPVASMSLAPLAPALAAVLGRPVGFAADCIGPTARAAAAALADGGVLLLENTRFHAGEEANDPAFAAALAELGDLYVNDAFSAAHRAHASTEALARLLPAAAGRLMQAELEALGRALERPARPAAALIGGAKVSTKLEMLGNLLAKVDVLLVGGAMANTFLAARGVDVGRSLVERDLIAAAGAIEARAKKEGREILLPVDATVAVKLAPGVASQTVAIDKIPADAMALDIGPASVAAFELRLAACRTVVWNGPVGAFETPPFDRATVALARWIAAATKAGRIMSVAGGGDTVAALAAAGIGTGLSYVSTAGGAFLEWLEGKELPGVAALAPPH
jgi:phosphoglycerate kinase